MPAPAADQENVAPAPPGDAAGAARKDDPRAAAPEKKKRCGFGDAYLPASIPEHLLLRVVPFSDASDPPRPPAPPLLPLRRSNRPREVKCPRVITEEVKDDRGATSTRTYVRGRPLGKGGFAVVYAVQDAASGVSYAAKVVAKSTLEKPRARAKILTEIRIHRAVRDGRVVRFARCFEDAANVYILMELCSDKTLADVVKRRGPLSLPEAAAYLREIVPAVASLHRAKIIHRDLKLGNVFLTAAGADEAFHHRREEDDECDANDACESSSSRVRPPVGGGCSNSNFSGGPGSDPELDALDAAGGRVKIGDFGLACRLASDDERKTTICGTPNYIAPEVLAGSKGGGHSYEVDVWSIGVILYTLLVGTPPFQTSDVRATYKKIRAGAYEFPGGEASSAERDEEASSAEATREGVKKEGGGGPHRAPRVRVAKEAEALIRWCLSPRPEDRPTAEEIAGHEILRTGRPDWRWEGFAKEEEGKEVGTGGEEVGVAKEAVKEAAKEAAASTEAAVPRDESSNEAEAEAKKAEASKASAPRPSAASRAASASKADSRAVSQAASARRSPPRRSPLAPLAPRRANGADPRPSSRAPLRVSEEGRRRAAPGAHSSGDASETPRRPASNPNPNPRANLRRTTAEKTSSSRPPSASPPARGAVAPRPSPEDAAARRARDQDEDENARPLPGARSAAALRREDGGPSEEDASEDDASEAEAEAEEGMAARANGQGSSSSAAARGVAATAAAETRVGHSAAASASEDASCSIMASFPPLWVTRWVDYTSKYGLGYVLSDGTFGVMFNDATKMAQSASQSVDARGEKGEGGGGGGGDRLEYRARQRAGKSRSEGSSGRADASSSAASSSSPAPLAFSASSPPPEGLEKKAKLMRHFRGYLDGAGGGAVERSAGGLCDDAGLVESAGDRSGGGHHASSGDGGVYARAAAETATARRDALAAGGASSAYLPHVKNWLRTRHAILFRLSNRTIQVRFKDGSEVLLSSEAAATVFVSKTGRRSAHRLSALPEDDPELLRRLRYVKEVLHQLVHRG